MIKWRAWFADGSIYNSRDHNWETIPNDGIVSVVVYQDWVPSSNKTKRYRRINDGYDYYFVYIDTIICNNLSPKENKNRFPEAKHFKKGKWVSDAEFKRISKLAFESKWFDETDPNDNCEGC